MNITRKNTIGEGVEHDADRLTAAGEGKIKITGARLIRWAGLAAMGSGIIFIAIQPVHPLDILSSVTTGTWAILQSLKFTMALLGLLGMVGLYARQAEKSGWLGLVGYLLFSLFYAFTAAFVFAEVFILPLLATEAPKFVEGFLGILTGAPSEVSLGVLPTIYLLMGLVGYMVGGLVFGIATFRAGVLPRWAGGLLAFGVVLPLLASSFVPHPYDRIFAVPVGLAMAWLGYALWSERQVRAAERSTETSSAQLRQSGSK